MLAPCCSVAGPRARERLEQLLAQRLFKQELDLAVGWEEPFEGRREPRLIKRDLVRSDQI